LAADRRAGRRPRRGPATGALLIALLLLGAAPARGDGLEFAVRDIVDTGVREGPLVGAIVAVGLPGRAPAIAAAGLRDRARGLPFRPDTPWRVASVTKTFVAALALRLAERGRLDLDAPLSRWLADVPNAGRVSPRRLLAHTAGYREYFTRDFAAAGRADPARPWTARGALAYARPQTLRFTPGGDFAYSNTDFVLLGLALEAAAGAPIADALAALVLDPAGLGDTRLAVARAPFPAGLARGYSDTDGDGLLEDVTDHAYALGWADNALVSTAADLVRGARALFAGPLLGPRARAAMRTPTPQSLARGSGYGLGVEVGAIDGITFVGHSGSVPGYNTLWRYAPASDVVLVVAVNEDPADADLPEALFRRLIGAVERETQVRFLRDTR